MTANIKEALDSLEIALEQVQLAGSAPTKQAEGLVAARDELQRAIEVLKSAPEDCPMMSSEGDSQGGHHRRSRFGRRGC
jgi:hypothetical protein